MQALWIAAAVSAGVAGLAATAERRRDRRTDRERVGWVPWSAILLVALFAGAMCVALALRS